MKKAHLPRWLGRAALRRTTEYASGVPTFAALHLDLFAQPARDNECRGDKRRIYDSSQHSAISYQQEPGLPVAGLEVPRTFDS